VGKWQTHVQGHVGKNAVAEEEVKAVNEIIDTFPAFHGIAQEGNDMAPVQGLLLQKGFACKRCPQNTQYCSGSKNGMAIHTTRNHKGTTVDQEPCFFQAINKRGAANFRVCILCHSLSSFNVLIHFPFL
jgi:hypothetical protein